mmetsp:Transcript_344/g.795  ORF Transcript_344/g.795 Transcript_344/m.795 type:complete len:307 (-) Transcript_344:149-1069(-)|eukprot:CAMPEP_0118938526 /NCGR_PEP_ID=MMETSP1169-20130426/26239_1 /TAXON_ID=36882 /ORGANISM="Pyramimonas obovata, Strain CCMP722" /LENGTH=306 /DNA_ID=CAMNT_0006882493 /DNA_START=179 /DNA_END=1099 /DNA_ORIENTATION=+
MAPAEGAAFSKLALTAASLWWKGFKDACAIHRTVKYLTHSRRIMLKTGRCFLLNGFIFLGSMLFMYRLMLPLAKWLLSFTPPPGSVSEGAPFEDPLFGSLASLLLGLYNVLWLYPAYVLSFVINSMWYQDIARQAYSLTSTSASTDTPPAPTASRRVGVASLGEELFRTILFAVFLAQVVLTSYVPVVGKPLYFVQLSWLYAYYCFDYKWSLAKWPLDARLHFVETHWAYFAGFGGPCTMSVVLLPRMVGEGVMSTLFPLFVLVAIGVEANPEAFKSRLSLGRLPVFRIAASQTVAIIRVLEPNKR